MAVAFSLSHSMYTKKCTKGDPNSTVRYNGGNSVA